MTTAFLSVVQLRKSKEEPASKSLVVGLIWLLIPILLDVLVLIPISEMTTTDYMQQIGMRYIVVPIIVSSQAFAMKMIPDKN